MSLAERRGAVPLELVSPAIQSKPILPSPQRSKLAMSIPTPKFAFGRTIFLEKAKVRWQRCPLMAVNHASLSVAWALDPSHALLVSWFHCWQSFSL